MRTVSGPFNTDLAEGVTTFCRIIRIIRKDGTILLLTDLDQDLVIGLDTYLSFPTFTISAILVTAALSANQGATLDMTMDETYFTETDLRNRRYEDAKVFVDLVNYTQLGHGLMRLLSGRFGNIRLTDKRRASIDVETFGGNNLMLLVEKYSQTCRASLGDARCTVDLVPLTVNFTVDTVVSNAVFTASELTAADNHFALGIMVWDTGDNAGVPSDVASNDQSDTSLTLVYPTLLDIQVGDTGHVVPGCDKRASTCRDKFDNIINFRGEPFAPQWHNTAPSPGGGFRFG